jgi:hypothetical protein
MIDAGRICPNCDGPLRIRSSKRLGSFREQRRQCCACGYRDVALVRSVEKVCSVRVVVGTTFCPPQAAAVTVGFEHGKEKENKNVGQLAPRVDGEAFAQSGGSGPDLRADWAGGAARA